MKQRENSAAGMVVGMAAGAALGAAGAMMVTQSKRQMRRNVRKVMKGAENAVMQLDKMATDFVEKHIDLISDIISKNIIFQHLITFWLNPIRRKHSIYIFCQAI